MSAQSSSTFDDRSLNSYRYQSTNLGAVTTAYTLPASCTAPCIKPLVDAYTWSTGGIRYSDSAVIGSACSWQGNEHSACVPTSYPSSMTMAYYSPAACPDGYTTACTASRIAFPDSVTARVCCPVNYYCDRAYERCFSIVPEGSTLTMDLLQVPSHSNYWSSATTTAVETVRTVWFDGITIAFQSTDTKVIELLQRTAFPTITASSTAIATPGAKITSVSPTGAQTPTSSPKGISTGGIAGIGIGAGLAVLLIIGATLLYVRRMKNSMRRAKKDGDEEKDDLDMAGRKPELSADETEKKLPILVEVDAVRDLQEVPAKEKIQELGDTPEVYELPVYERVLELPTPADNKADPNHGLYCHPSEDTRKP